MSQRRAMVDALAEQLSGYTGSKFTVLRGQIDGKRVYGLRAERGEYSHRFQGHRPMKYNDLLRWLASICDMINMGFISVQRKPHREE